MSDKGLDRDKEMSERLKEDTEHSIRNIRSEMQRLRSRILALFDRDQDPDAPAGAST